MNKTISFFLGLFALVSFAACNSAPQNASADIAVNRPKHVILIGFDGFSSYSLNNGAEMPTLREMMKKGAYDLKGRSVLPSSSAVNWASMFMGAGPELHGYTEWGSRSPDLPSRVVNKDNRFPNIFGLYREQHPKAEIGYLFEWEGMHYLVDTLAMSYRKQVPLSNRNPEGALSLATSYIKEKKPNLMAVIFDQPDGTGHRYGWSTKEYFDQMTFLDGCLKQLLEAVKEAGIMDETVIIVTSDHGGIDKGHGGKTMDEMERPVIFYGKGIKKGHEVKESTMIYDLAATLAVMLDVQQPQVWIARPMMSIFE